MTESEWLSCDDPQRMMAWLTGTDNTPWMDESRWKPAPSDRKLRLFACGCCRLVWDGTPCERCGGKGRLDEGLPLERGRCARCNGTGRIGGLTDPRSRRAVGVAEAFADGLATAGEMRAACDAAQDLPHAIHPIPEFDVGLRAATAASWAAADHPATSGGSQIAASSVLRYLPEFAAAQASLLRSIVGNPFRPYHKHGNSVAPFARGIPSVWLTPNVASLAQACYGGEACLACKGDGKRFGTTASQKGDCHKCRGSGRTPFDAAGLWIVADALEEAGCTDERILMHLRGYDRCASCRGDGLCHEGYRGTSPDDPCKLCSGTGWRKAAQQRVRGDWVVDAILGKG